MRFILAVLLILGSVQGAEAFDGKRKGFVLGAGLGAGLGSFSVDVIKGGVVDEMVEDDEIGFASSSKIGFGATEQLVLFIGSHGLATSSMRSDVFGPGFSAYFSEDVPSMYVMAAGGIALIEPEDIDGDAGPGVLGGIGWEFSRHWSVEATLSWMKANKDEKTGGSLFSSPDAGFDADNWSIMVTFAGLAY